MSTHERKGTFDFGLVTELRPKVVVMLPSDTPLELCLRPLFCTADAYTTYVALDDPRGMFLCLNSGQTFIVGPDNMTAFVADMRLTETRARQVMQYSATVNGGYYDGMNVLYKQRPPDSEELECLFVRDPGAEYEDWERNEYDETEEEHKERTRRLKTAFYQRYQTRMSMTFAVPRDISHLFKKKK